MTDKQIIIDGVDVSGCSYYADGKCTNSQIIQSNCKNVVVCYHKEYKRKKQECEEFKETFDGLLKVQYKLAHNNKKLRQCLTEIKEIAEPYYTLGSKDSPVVQILQKINECEGENEV